MSGPLRVIKLGGSLLDWPELPERIRQWLATQPPAVNLLVVGGGGIVDELRRLDQVHHLPAEASHWLAIEAMRLTARLALEIFPGIYSVESCKPFELPDGSLAVCDVADFLREDSLRSDALPIGWDVTSDSIAARLAQRLDATELVLLKSCSSPPADLAELARLGVVDAAFPSVARGLKVRLVNLREHDEETRR